MEEEEEVVFIKVFDQKKGDVVFEGKVSTDVQPHELVWLRCFRKRYLYCIFNKASNVQLISFKGLRNNVELVAELGVGEGKGFSGVLYVGACDGVLRKSTTVPSCECVLMSTWNLSRASSEKVFKCETLEVLEINWGEPEILSHIGKMKKLKKLRLFGLKELQSIDMGELSSLEELQIEYCGIERLPKRLKELELLRSISLEDLYDLQLHEEDLIVFSKLKQLRCMSYSKVFTSSFAQAFWEMTKSTTGLRSLDLDWDQYKQEIVVSALEENGSIIDGGLNAHLYAHIFKRNKSNHERARECAVYVLAIRRWRNALNNFPKEMVRMIAIMVWITRCDVKAWSKKRDELVMIDNQEGLK